MKDITVILRTRRYAEAHWALDYLKANNVPCILRNIDTEDFSGIGQLASGINPVFGVYELCVGTIDSSKAGKLLQKILPDRMQRKENLSEAPSPKKNPRKRK